MYKILLYNYISYKMNYIICKSSYVLYKIYKIDPNKFSVIYSWAKNSMNQIMLRRMVK